MSIEFATNLEDLAEGIGNLMGMGLGIEQAEYMDAMLKSAFAKADRKFNEIAPSSAKRMDFTHMFEYNSTIYEDGTVPATTKPARLWQTTLTGGGGRKNINFVFLPAKSPRTATTEEEVEGIDPDIVEKLAVNNGVTYKWPTKASDTENNKRIFLKPRKIATEKDSRKHPGLLIPIVQGLNDASEKEEEQGFGWRTRYTNMPGEWTGGANAFTGFFYGYWTGKGGKIMEAGMIEKFNHDVKGFAKELGVTPSKPKSANMTNIKGKVSEATAKTRKQWTIKTVNEEGSMEVFM